MTTQQLISKTLLDSRNYSATLLEQILTRQTYGEPLGEIKIDFIILNAQIEALQRYHDNAFDDNGSVVEEPVYDCLTSVQALNLVNTLKVAIGQNKYSYSNWILADGTWNDDGIWDDNDTWNDSQPLN